jgi:transmembrane 9 superfamily protein 2/4
MAVEADVASHTRSHSVPSVNGKNDCSGTNLTPLSEKETSSVTYSYSVNWVESKTPWGTRWDHYLYISDEKVHWFSIINSAVIALLLTGMVSIILLRALHQDISRYNSAEPQEDLAEEFGWKLVHGDVFRPPAWSMLLCVMVGNGAQVVLMSSVTLVIAALGFLSPSSRGSLSTVMLVFYFLFASVSGYVSARLYKMFSGQAWRQNVLATSFLVPGCVSFCAPRQMSLKLETRMPDSSLSFSLDSTFS